MRRFDNCLAELLMALLASTRACLIFRRPPLGRLFEGTKFDPATSRRRFVLMASDIVVSLVAPLLTERVRRAAPQVSLEIVPWRGHNLLTEEFLRSVDAVTSNRGAAFPGFRRQTLYKDRDVLAVRRGHPVGSKLGTPKAFLAARHIAIVGVAIPPIRSTSGSQLSEWSVAVVLSCRAISRLSTLRLKPTLSHSCRVGSSTRLPDDFSCLRSVRPSIQVSTNNSFSIRRPRSTIRRLFGFVRSSRKARSVGAGGEGITKSR